LTTRLGFARASKCGPAALDLMRWVRAAARPLVTRAGANRCGFQTGMFDAVLQTAFRTEPAEGFARDAAELAGDCLGAECEGLDSEHCGACCNRRQGAASSAHDSSCTRAA